MKKYSIIIEPNESLHNPYTHLDSELLYDRCTSIESGLRLMSNKSPDIMFLSASFTVPKSLIVLEALKNLSTRTLIPLILVVDLSHKLSSIPGTTWGNKLGIVSSLSSVNELNSTLDRVFSA